MRIGEFVVRKKDKKRVVYEVTTSYGSFYLERVIPSRTRTGIPARRSRRIFVRDPSEYRTASEDEIAEAKRKRREMWE